MTGIALVDREHLQDLAMAHGVQVEIDNEKNTATCRIGGTTFVADLPDAGGAK